MTEEILELNGHIVVGFTGENIIFSKNDQYISIKAILPKKDLILKLGIKSSQITRKLKDGILDEASKQGKWSPNFLE